MNYFHFTGRSIGSCPSFAFFCHQAPHHHRSQKESKRQSFHVFPLFWAKSVPPARRGGHDTGHDFSLIEATEHVKKKCLYVNSWGAPELFATSLESKYGKTQMTGRGRPPGGPGARTVSGMFFLNPFGLGPPGGRALPKRPTWCGLRS